MIRYWFCYYPKEIEENFLFKNYKLIECSLDVIKNIYKMGIKGMGLANIAENIK